MCIAAVGGIPAFVSILGTAASLGGTLVTGLAARNAAIAQQQQDRNNAVIAQRNAADARARGTVAEQEVQLRTRAMIGKQLNVLSERNIALNSGSALDIIGDTAMFGKLDALTTRQNFEREAIGHEAQRMNFNASAEQSRMRASSAMWGTGASLFSTALGGVSDFYRARDMRL